ncbi:MAG: secretin N-terminal domain-containing protein [Rubripirellula sp.]|nr:secretin N-terminal domain-containing protein [Rubripirellula sp.]
MANWYTAFNFDAVLSMKSIFNLCFLALAGALLVPGGGYSQDSAPTAEAAAQDSPGSAQDSGGESTPAGTAEPAVAQDPPAVSETQASASTRVAPARPVMPAEPVSPTDKQQLRFSFAGTPWPQVLDWFAEEADLALQLDQSPSGSFTFSDPTRTYSIAEALDVINLTLMKSGYTLVRRGRILQVIDLELENADKMISEIAELVAPDQLEERGKSDVVSSVFPLGSMTPAEAREEIAQMVGPWGRVIVLDSARQVKVTETAGKLMAIRDLLDTASQADSNVIEIVLENRGADELLEIARPLLGLDAGENSGDDIRISVGLFGDRIYAAGLPGKTGLLQSIVEKADQPLEVPDGEEGAEVAKPVFQTHTVSSADITTVFDVLQTLLAGTPEARIAIDPKTNAIIAWARPETHTLINTTVTEMEGKGTSFKVIDLRRLDPTQALLTINKFFGVSEEGEGDGPIVDGDPATGKLWVRGTETEIALIEKLLSELEGSDSLGGLSEKVRLLPYSGRAAEDALEQIESLWPVTGRKNQIRTFSPSRGNGGSNGNRGGIPERRVPRQPPPANTPPVDTTEASIQPQQRYHLVVDQVVTGATEATPTVATTPQDSSSIRLNVEGADIVVQMTPAGMLIASEDTEALDAFQSLLESLATPSGVASDLPTIIWLKYIKADVASELIAKVLGGGESSISSAVESVAGGLGGGMLGLLGGFGGGGGESTGAQSILTSSGSVNIVPDPRLNALIIQANPVDMQMIELILEKIDIQESPEDVETVAKPALIPVIYQDASDVATVVKSVFADRVTGGEASRGGGGRGGQPSPEDFINALRGRGGRGGGGGGGSATSEPAKISIAVDTKSNSLVVTATPQDFKEVRELVEALDYSSQPSEEVVEIAPLRGDVNPEVIKLALESILGQQTGSTKEASASNSSSSSGSTGSSSQTSMSDIQRRIEAFRAMRDGAGSGFRGFGGSSRGGPGGFGGGSRGGPGGGGSGGGRGPGGGGR